MFSSRKITLMTHEFLSHLYQILREHLHLLLNTALYRRSEDQQLRNNPQYLQRSHHHTRWLFLVLLPMCIFVSPVLTQTSLNNVGVLARPEDEVYRSDSPRQSETCALESSLFALDSMGHAVCYSRAQSDDSIPFRSRLKLNSLPLESDDSHFVFMTLDPGTYI